MERNKQNKHAPIGKTICCFPEKWKQHGKKQQGQGRQGQGGHRLRGVNGAEKAHDWAIEERLNRGKAKFTTSERFNFRKRN